MLRDSFRIRAIFLALRQLGIFITITSFFKTSCHSWTKLEILAFMPSVLKKIFRMTGTTKSPARPLQMQCQQAPGKLPVSYFTWLSIRIFIQTESIISAILLLTQFQRPQSEYDYIALNTRRGQRAMIIKNNDGDWGVLLGSWVDRRKAAAKSEW